MPVVQGLLVEVTALAVVAQAVPEALQVLALLVTVGLEFPHLSLAHRLNTLGAAGVACHQIT
jgi:hypothetical protein